MWNETGNSISCVYNILNLQNITSDKETTKEHARFFLIKKNKKNILRVQPDNFGKKLYWNILGTKTSNTSHG